MALSRDSSLFHLKHKAVAACPLQGIPRLSHKTNDSSAWYFEKCKKYKKTETYVQRIKPKGACRERKQWTGQIPIWIIYYSHAAVKWGTTFFFFCSFVCFLANSRVDRVCCFILRTRKLLLGLGRGSNGKLTVSLLSISALFIRRNERFIWQQQFNTSATFTALREEDHPSADWHKTWLQ